jgi:hypothetical protein
MELRDGAGGWSLVRIFNVLFRRVETQMLYDLIGLIELILVIWALIGILQSGAPPVEKLIWVVIILVIPLIGFILWYLMGPGSKSVPGRR